MRILLTNDDGPFGPGLLPLRNALAQLGEVQVVCPDRERSGAGHAITVLAPLRRGGAVLADGSRASILSGTPADCVKFALLHRENGPFDLVVSGINTGINAGPDLFYSGTVAAAIEAALLDHRGVAFSTSPANCDRMDRVAAHALEVVDILLQEDLTAPWAANVNVPPLGQRPPTVRFTRQGQGFASGDITLAKGTRGRIHYWLDAPVGAPQVPEDSDIAVLGAGDISVTPLRVDLTDEAALRALTAAGRRADG